MPTQFPLAASGDKTPKRAQPVPAGVKTAIRSLVWGGQDDDEAKPLSLMEAAALGGVTTRILRKWVERPEGRALLLGERRSYLSFALAGNPKTLVSIRDKGQNDMARVRAALAIEELGEVDTGRSVADGGHPQALQINIIAADGSRVAIDASSPPRPALAPAPSPPSPAEPPIFQPPSW